jgi:hypothetical protein
MAKSAMFVGGTVRRSGLVLDVADEIYVLANGQIADVSEIQHAYLAGTRPVGSSALPAHRGRRPRWGASRGRKRQGDEAPDAPGAPDRWHGGSRVATVWGPVRGVVHALVALGYNIVCLASGAPGELDGRLLVTMVGRPRSRVGWHR